MDQTLTRAQKRQARRVARAAETRRQALSPMRILLRVAAIPVLATTIGLSVYIRTSDHAPGDALRHLVAMAGCEAAAAVRLAPAAQGQLGYHVRNDADGDGIACGHAAPDLASRIAARAPAPPVDTTLGPADRQMSGGAKFVKP